MKKLPRLKQEQIFVLALIFILINATIWLIFAVLAAVNACPDGVHPDCPPLDPGKWALIAAGVLFVLQILLRRHNRVAYYLALSALAGLVLLTFMDQVGISDLIYAVIALPRWSSCSSAGAGIFRRSGKYLNY